MLASIGPHASSMAPWPTGLKRRISRWSRSGPTAPPSPTDGASAQATTSELSGGTKRADALQAPGRHSAPGPQAVQRAGEQAEDAPEHADDGAALDRAEDPVVAAGEADDQPPHHAEDAPADDVALR